MSSALPPTANAAGIGQRIPRLRLASAMRATLAMAMTVAMAMALSAARPAGAGEPSPTVAPDFRVVDLDGHPVELSRYRGKVVLLNFWASWCAPCLDEMPRFSRWQQRYGGEGLQVLGLSMDDDVHSARAAALKLRVTYPVAMGDAALGERFGGVLGLPLSLLIDPRGRIVARFQGEAKLADLEARIRALLPLGPK